MQKNINILLIANAFPIGKRAKAHVDMITLIYNASKLASDRALSVRLSFGW